MKIVITLFVLLSYSIAHGQTDKGTMLIGGSSDFSFGGVSTTFESNNDNISDPGRSLYLFIGPKLGYFIIDNWVVGLALPTGLNFSKNDFSKSRNFNLGVGPFSRYYFGSGILRPVVEGGVSLGLQNSRTTDQNDQVTKNKQTFFTGNVGIGAAVFLTESVSLDGILGYEHIRQSPDISDIQAIKSSRLSFNIGISVFF